MRRKCKRNLVVDNAKLREKFYVHSCVVPETHDNLSRWHDS